MKRLSSRAQKQLALIVAGLLALGAIYRILSMHGPGDLQVLDIGADSRAGTIDRISGSPQTRPLLLSELEAPEADRQEGASQSAVLPGEPLHVGMMFMLPAKAMIQLTTEGGWKVVLDGEGEFAFVEARTNPERTAHYSVWRVKAGTFRASAAAASGPEAQAHFMEIHTSRATITFEHATIGIRVAGEAAQAWVMSGEAKILWKDGRTKTLGPRSAQNL